MKSFLMAILKQNLILADRKPTRSMRDSKWRFKNERINILAFIYKDSLDKLFCNDLSLHWASHSNFGSVF